MKTQAIVLLAALLTAGASFAGDNIPHPRWEYSVVYLPGTATQGMQPKLRKLDGGAMEDVKKTEALASLARDGWEIISVTGDSGADHALYLRRAISTPQ